MLNIGIQRWLTHLGLAFFTLFGSYVAALYAPHAALNYVLTLGCGYTALVLLVVGLVIGPVYLLRQRKNPVNIQLRRDVGIWSAITGGVHVIFGLQIHMSGDIRLYFLEPMPNHIYRPLLNRFGISNDIGLLAALLLILLLVLSNDWSLRLLKGRRWKLLQRFNYLLFALTLVHTFLYQLVSRRQHEFTRAVLILTLLVLLAQAFGFQVTRARRMLAHRW